MKAKKYVVVAAEAALALAGATAQAQQSASNDMVTIEEVVVTAQRREQSLKDVPLTVNVVSAASLQEHHFSDPAQLPYLAPGLQVTNFQASPGATNFSVRGIGTPTFSHLIEPSVATVIDGVVMGRPEMGVMKFADLERIEVLSGPQGMLFGKNAIGGLVNVVTAKPKLNEFSVSAHAEYGNTDAVANVGSTLIQGTVNAPIGSTTAVRLGAFYSDASPLIRDVTPPNGSDYGFREKGGRLKFLWEPSEAFSLNVSGDYTRGNGMGTGAYTQRVAVPGSVYATQNAEVGIVAGVDNLYRSADAPTNIDFQVGGAQAEASLQLGSGGPVLTNILAYRSYTGHHVFDGDIHQTDNLNSAQAWFRFNQYTDELRIASPSSSKIEYQAGLFFYNARASRFDVAHGGLNIDAPPPAGLKDWLGLVAYDVGHNRSYAGYGQATFHLTDKLRWTVGARETFDRNSLEDTNDPTEYAFSFAAPDTSGKVYYIKANNFSWRTSLQYDVTSDVTTYATVSRGYKGPGFNLGYSGGQSVNPETAYAYEFGLKSTLFNRLVLNASVFWQDISNLQVQSFNSETLSYLIQNAGKLRSRGLEANAAFKATRGLTLTAGMIFNDAKFVEFSGAQCYAGQTAAQGCVDGASDASGNPLQNAPRWTGNIGADYKQDLTATLEGFVRADMYSRSQTNFSANGDPNTRMSPYTLLNASIGLGAADSKWQASVFCRNCLDRRFVTYIEASALGAAGEYNQSFGPDSFRTVGVSLDVHF